MGDSLPPGAGYGLRRLQPATVIVTPNRLNVYVTNDDPANNISQYTVGTGGKLSEKNPATVAAGPSPSGMAETANSKNVYVAITGSSHLVPNTTSAQAESWGGNEPRGMRHMAWR